MKSPSKEWLTKDSVISSSAQDRWDSTDETNHSIMVWSDDETIPTFLARCLYSTTTFERRVAGMDTLGNV